MHTSVRRKLLGAALASILSGQVATAIATSTPISAQVGLGLAPQSQAAQITLHLNLHNQAALEKFIQDSVTPGSPSYHKFLTPSQFAAQYGATDAEIAKVQSFLQSQGLGSEVLPNHLAVRSTGTIGQVSTTFKTTIRTAVSSSGQQFAQPVSKFVVPTSLNGIVNHISGLGLGRTYQSHRRRAPQAAQALKASLSAAVKAADSGNPTASGQPGEYTVGDVANLYNINPLYSRGVDGNNSTVAIIALSGFSASDPDTYWKTIGLSTKANRITTIAVDGGAPLDGNNGETALDIEQAGGIAPQADILVYEAPNGSAKYPNSYTDAFQQAVTDNIADAITTSWGTPELFSFASTNSGGTGPTDTTDEGDLQTFHALLLEAAAQGQSVFAASGDSGAYDTVRGLCGAPNYASFSDCVFTAPLTVDSPASDPYITAAGGTTAPITLRLRSTGQTVVDIEKESVWGWDYLVSPVIGITRDDVYSVGGGGGVSVYWPIPAYQRLTRGIRLSAAEQSLIETDPGQEPYTWSILPANFKGRNVPDISFNADPESGYLSVESTVNSTTGEVTPGVLVSGNGGTSFVAPQLAGVAALLRQSTKGRVGFLNPMLYKLFNSTGYGNWTPFNAIRAGDNWYYHGLPIYNPGAGIGTLNVANFDTFLHRQ